MNELVVFFLGLHDQHLIEPLVLVRNYFATLGQLIPSAGDALEHQLVSEFMLKGEESSALLTELGAYLTRTPDVKLTNVSPKPILNFCYRFLPEFLKYSNPFDRFLSKHLTTKVTMKNESGTKTLTLLGVLSEFFALQAGVVFNEADPEPDIDKSHLFYLTALIKTISLKRELSPLVELFSVIFQKNNA